MEAIAEMHSYDTVAGVGRGASKVFRLIGHEDYCECFGN